MEESKPPHEAVTSTAMPSSTVSQVMDVVVPPPAETPTATNPHTPLAPDGQSDKKAAKTKPPKPPKAPAQPKAHGVNAAIFATVVIVLGLALLAVYAYQHQK